MMTTAQPDGGPIDRYSKPSYDGRLHYHEVVKSYMVAISNASITGDFPAWIRLIRGLWALTHSYINPKMKPGVKTLLDDLNRKNLTINMKTMSTMEAKYWDIQLDILLQEITEKLYEATKDLLLPIKDDDDEDFDVDSFTKGLL